jgi:hypothetical protein
MGEFAKQQTFPHKKLIFSLPCSLAPLREMFLSALFILIIAIWATLQICNISHPVIFELALGELQITFSKLIF